MKTERRDAATERLIQGLLQHDGSLPAPGGACLDGDTLAAMMDGALSGTDRAAAERHAASCGRCQALLAAAARIEPVPDQSGGRRRVPLRWLIPAGGLAAAAVALWIAAAPRDRVTQTNTTAVTAPAAPQSVGQARAADEAQDRLGAQARQSTLEAPAAGAAGARVATSPAADILNATRAPASSSPAVPGPPAMSAADRSSDPRAATAQSSMPPLALRESVSEGFHVAMTITSPNPLIRWRTGRGGIVDRSTDGGATWQPQTVPTAEILTAGSSPSPQVCWLVGSNGIVLLAFSSEPWRRVPFPESSNLQAVHAADQNTATVTTSDGRQFSTVDGGKTWKNPPLQETSAAAF